MLYDIRNSKTAELCLDLIHRGYNVVVEDYMADPKEVKRHYGIELNKPFDGYDQVPGEIEILGNTMTHMQLTFEFGIGKRFILFDRKKLNVVWVPSVSAGVMVGKARTAVTNEGEWWASEGA